MDTVVSPIKHREESTEMDESCDNEEMQYDQLILSSSSTSVVMGEGEEEKRKKVVHVVVHVVVEDRWRRRW